MFMPKSYLVVGAVLLFMVVVNTPFPWALAQAPAAGALPQTEPMPAMVEPLTPAATVTSSTPAIPVAPNIQHVRQPIGQPIEQPVSSALPLSSLDTECLRIAYGHNAAAVALFDDAVVRESMAQPYPLEPLRPTPHMGEHPGRVRSYALLGAVYGHTKEEVQGQLQTVSFMGQSLRLSAVAAAALTRVAQTLTALAQEQPQLKVYMRSEGGFMWRTIAGDTRLSPHSFGIAVDLNSSKGPYWLWAAPAKRASQGAAARASYPAAIVAAFEAEGFIWGGKWYEYDMMHFEYRPELICKARALQN